MLLAAQVATDAAEHGTARNVRIVAGKKRAHPWLIKGSRVKSAALIISKLMLNFIGTCFEKVVPALSASAMIMLLITHGSGTTDIILNGLAVIFVLELDNLMGPAFLTCRQQTIIKEWTSEILSHDKMKQDEMRRSDQARRRESANMDAATARQMTSKRWDVLDSRHDRVAAESNTLCICIFVAQNVGFFRATCAWPPDDAHAHAKHARTRQTTPRQLRGAPPTDS